jgi:hypothetical protein
VEAQPGRFDLRGALNELRWLDQVRLTPDMDGFGALGVKTNCLRTIADGKSGWAEWPEAVSTRGRW